MYPSRTLSYASGQTLICLNTCGFQTRATRLDGRNPQGQNVSSFPLAPLGFAQGIALLALLYGITKSLPRGYGGGGPCEAWWKGRLGRYRFSIVRNTHEQRAPLSPRFARHFPRLGRGKLNVVIKSLPCRSGGGGTRQRDGGGALSAQGYALIEMKSNNILQNTEEKICVWQFRRKSLR